MRVRDGDEASCLNLNRALKPRLLGVQPGPLAQRKAFAFASAAPGLDKSKGWELLRRPSGQDSIPAIGDEASILWAMGKKLGDTMDFVNEQGQSVKVKLVAAVANSILQGNLVMDETEFLKQFPNESGYRFFLMDTAKDQVGATSATLSKSLKDFGMEITTTTRRLAEFNAVQNTYLGTFQALGGLGLLLGSFGLGVLVLRNVLERRSELALLGALGFTRKTVSWLVLAEHGALCVAGLGLGVVAAGVAVLPSLLSATSNLPLGRIGLTLATVAINGVLWTWAATKLALRGSLVESLRSE